MQLPFRTLVMTGLGLALLLVTLPMVRAEQKLRVAGPNGIEASFSAGDLTSSAGLEIKDTREIEANGQKTRLEIRYGGVSLPGLLKDAGIDRLDRYALRSATILLTARDGYRASFSWGELFNHAAGEQVLVIIRENGNPNPAREGVFSLRAFGDLRPGPRHVRDLAEIRIILPPG